MHALRTTFESRLSRFALLTFIFLTLGVAVWFFASDVYLAFIGAAANGLLWFLGQSNLGRFVVQGGTMDVYHQAPGVTSPIEVAGFYAFFNLVVCLALLLATPGVPARRRAVLVALGIAAMVGVHLFTLYVNLRLTYLFSRQLVHPSRWSAFRIQSGQILTGAVGEQLFPILIWGLLTLRYWVGDVGNGMNRWSFGNHGRIV
jgi:hypothetical protein